jgi:ferredoxin
MKGMIPSYPKVRQRARLKSSLLREPQNSLKEKALKDECSQEEPRMAYVIAEPCVNTKDTACVDVCPVDCIHPRKDEANFADVPMLYIDPVECIDCGACVPVCPVSAIFPLDDLPEKWGEYTASNAQYYQK